jgi:hypothetical protein
MMIYCHPRFGVQLFISANETAWIVYKFLYVEENIIQSNVKNLTVMNTVHLHLSLQCSSVPKISIFQKTIIMICYYNGHHLEAEMLHLSQNLPKDYKGSMSARSMIQRHTTSKQGQVKWESLNCKTYSKNITRSNFHLQSSVLSSALNHLGELPVRKV